MASVTREDIFTKWLSEVRENNLARYGRDDRKRHLSDLVNAMKLNGIPQDELYFLKKKVVLTLVTEEGLKGRGKHKGWKENTEADFEDEIQRVYVASYRAKEQSSKLVQTFSEDPNIIDWCRKTFGPNVDAFTIKEAHGPNTMLYFRFVDEYHNRNTGVNYGLPR